MRTTVIDGTSRFDLQTRAYAEYRVFSQLARDGATPREVAVTLTRGDADASTGEAVLCAVAITMESGDVAQVQARGRHPYAAIDNAAALIAAAVGSSSRHLHGSRETAEDADMKTDAGSVDMRVAADNVPPRSPFVATVPRSVKRTRGRADAPRTPAHVRVIGLSLDDDDRGYIYRKLGMRFGKFASGIERITIRITDENGPRGGVDVLCRVKVVLRGLPSVLVETRSASLQAAVDGALRAAGQAVQRRMARRRLKPLHSRRLRSTPAVLSVVE